MQPLYKNENLLFKDLLDFLARKHHPQAGSFWWYYASLCEHHWVLTLGRK
jgi:hypothetical protein